MPDKIQIILIDHQGNPHPIDVSVGQSIMEAAVINGVPGVQAECGGSPQCGTCSVFVPDEWSGLTGSPDDLEINVLKFNNKFDDKRRLSCQLVAQSEWHGMQLLLPKSQY